MDFSLAPGNLTETVEVAAVSPLLKTDRADVATRFEAKQITDLPVLDRNFTKFILLTPGTQQQQWGHAASENPQGSTQTVVNGQSFSGTSYQLDGTDNRDPILGIIVINPTLESIGETKITSQNYDAEFGQAVAGVVSVQTKSGGNDFHGSVFEFNQNDRFQSRNPFTQAQPNALTGKFLPDTQKNQFGGSLGGKIIENRMFFFGDYQGRRNTEGGSRLLTVPTAAARTGDLSAYGVNIYDPLTGSGAAAAVPGNVIPASRLSPQAQKILPSSRCPMPRGATTAPATTTSPRIRRSSTRTRSTSASTAGLATARTRSRATAAASSCATGRPRSGPAAAASSSASAVSRTSRTRASRTASTTPSHPRC